MIGTGIFATPSGILELSGSVGLSLFLWVAGMLIAAAGMAVYLEFGTAMPKNGESPSSNSSLQGEVYASKSRANEAKCWCTQSTALSMACSTCADLLLRPAL